MKKLNGYMRGIGIGGWLTNYKRMAQIPKDKQMDVTIGDMEHFASYITEWDVANIASFGVDHIRLAFDQLALETFKEPYVYREEVWEHIDHFLVWAKKYHLNVILNLHHAFGCYCDCGMDKPLLDTLEYRERFVKLWIRFEERYHSLGNEIMFELMNEITDSKSDKWITLYKETIAAIRALNPTRLIMVGSAQWNSVDKVCDLEVLDDPNVVYTFHFYTPFEFTHQRGVLQNMQHYYNREMPYPSDVEPYRDFGRTIWGSANAYEGYDRIDKKLLYDCLAPAKAFIEAHPDAILTCGEFGTIRHIKNEHRENWFRDVISFCDENEIPITIWNYLSTPYDGNRFSLVDDDFRKPVSEKIIEMIRIK